MWCGGSSLKEAFPSLHNMASVKDTSSATNMDYSSGSLQWNVSFIRLVHDWEVDVLASFYTLLYSHKIRREREDKIWWVPSRKGKFDVRSFCKILTHNETICFPWRSIWQTKTPLRVAFFVWTAVLGKILTLDNLRKRQLIMINICCLCKLDGETVDHILLQCEVACFMVYLRSF